MKAQQGKNTSMQCQYYSKKTLLANCVDYPLYPHLDASCDGVTNCDCCGNGLLEIKCFFSMKLRYASW